MFCIEERTNGELWASARSEHGPGVNASMCDGSVHFIASDIDLEVWRALATRAGGEPVQPPE